MDWFERLRGIKAKSQKSTYEISVESGIPEPTLEKIFSGKTKNPGINTIQVLVHTLGHTLDDLYQATEKPLTPEAEDGRHDSVTAQIMDIVGQMSPEEKQLYLENLKTLRRLQEQGRKPDIQG